MRYFIDTEFIPQTLDLISVGVVAEDGRELYLQNVEFDPKPADDFVRDFVFPQLSDRERFSDYYYSLPSPGGLLSSYTETIHAWRTCQEIRSELQAFCDIERYAPPLFWTDCGAFDFVLISRLFGAFSQWPSGWPYYFGDLQQWADQIGLVLPPQTTHPHHALWDARHNRVCFDLLQGTPRSIRGFPTSAAPSTTFWADR